MLRKVLSVLAGISVAVLIFMAFEALKNRLYPIPANVDRANHQQMEAFVNTLPLAALLLDLAGWIVGSFLCGIVVRLITRTPAQTSAYIAGLFLMTAGIVDIFILPHPVWFIILGLLTFIPFTLLGHFTAGKMRLSSS
jgi:hypothetical protein